MSLTMQNDEGYTEYGYSQGFAAAHLLVAASIPGIRRFLELPVREPRPEGLDFDADWIAPVVADVLTSIPAAWARGERFRLNLSLFARLVLQKASERGVDASAFVEWLNYAVRVMTCIGHSGEQFNSHAWNYYNRHRNKLLKGRELHDENAASVAAMYSDLGAHLDLRLDIYTILEELVPQGTFDVALSLLDPLFGRDVPEDDPWDYPMSVIYRIDGSIDAHILWQWIARVLDVMTSDEIEAGFRVILEPEAAEDTIRYLRDLIARYRRTSL